MKSEKTEAAAAPAAYAVGYKKPPLHTRFKKGQSGNPSGRRRGARNLPTALLEAIDRRVEVEEDGRRRKRSKRDLGADRLADKFARGDPYAIRLLLGLVLDLQRRLPPEPPAPVSLDENDKSVIENWLIGPR
jgi:hypothetical protein